MQHIPINILSYGLPNKPVYGGELFPGHGTSAEVVTDSLGPQVL